MPICRARSALIFPLALLLVPLSSQAADRSAVLLYKFQSATPATPAPVTDILASLVREELQKRGRFVVLVRDPDDPEVRRAEADQPTREPTRLHHAFTVARSLGAQYLVQGVITAYEPPQADQPGKVTLRLTAASVATEASRDVFVTAEMKVAEKGTAAAKVLGPAARAAAVAIATEAIPALDRSSPTDRAQAAEQARARAADAAAAGVAGQAVQELRGAARLDPEDGSTHQALGEALVKQGHIASALLEFREALALEEAAGPSSSRSRRLTDEELSSLRLRLVRGLADRGLWDEAMAEAGRGLEQEPESVPLRLATAEAALRKGDGAAALAALSPLHAARPPRDSEWNLLAEAYSRMADAPRWLDALVRGALDGVPEANQYTAVIRRLDLAFRALADEAEDEERRLLAGQLAISSLGAGASRRLQHARVVVEYLGRLAFPEGGEAAHEVRQEAWSGLLRSAEQARRFADGGSYDDLAAARGERLRALARLEPTRAR